MLNILIAFSVSLLSSIYNVSINDTDGHTISLSEYRGKKILLVNIATGSERVSQLASLQQLQQQYHDSLVIIAFPSNSFGNEPRSNAEIKTFCQSTYNCSFIIAAKNSVTGGSAQPVYSWLSNAAANGASSISIAGDFQKILIDKEGDIIGIFAPAVNLTDASFVQAINQ